MSEYTHHTYLTGQGKKRKKERKKKKGLGYACMYVHTVGSYHLTIYLFYFAFPFLENKEFPCGAFERCTTYCTHRTVLVHKIYFSKGFRSIRL